MYESRRTLALLRLYYTFQSWTGMTANAAIRSFAFAGRGLLTTRHRNIIKVVSRDITFREAPACGWLSRGSGAGDGTAIDAGIALWQAGSSGFCGQPVSLYLQKLGALGGIGREGNGVIKLSWGRLAVHYQQVIH